MKAWEKPYDVDVLEEAINLVDNVEIIQSDGVEFIAEIESFEVKTYIQYNSPTYTFCNCPKNGYCKHEASLIYYLINHPELYLMELDFNEQLNQVSENNLKKFLLKELESNDELKKKFMNEFQNNIIDKDYYRNKLSDVFKSGEGKDFEYHGIYDLDLMGNSLYDFIFEDISNILSAGEYEFACELLIRIADLLNDEMMSTYNSWYDLVDRFMEHVHVLSTSIYLDSQKMDELYSKMDVINNLM